MKTTDGGKKRTKTVRTGWHRRLLFAAGGLLSVFLIGLSVLSAAENGNVAEELLPVAETEELPPVVETEELLPVAETEELPPVVEMEDDGYLQKALEQDELDDDNLFRLEDAVVRNEPDAPQPPENDWEKKVAYINEIELPSQVVYDFYEEKLPEDVIDTEAPKNVHPKISGIKIEVSRKPPYFGRKPVIAIVIDDMGVSHRRTANISSLDYPLTSSFLTYVSNLRPQIAAAERAGHEIIAHLPMEPKASMNVSPDVLTVKMNEKQVAEGLNGMLDKFPGIAGVNNHMGSRFTEDPVRMDVVMKELEKRGLFFLDSKTTPHSAGEKAAKDNRVRYVSRNVFLDNEDKFDYVMRQLRQTEAIARKNGYAVAIGHPKEQTYNALKVWLPTLKSRNLRLVHLSEIVKALN